MNTLRHSFPGQETDESVYVFTRPYFIAFIPTMAAFLFIFILSALFQFGLANNSIMNLTTETINASILGIGIFQLLAVIVFFIALFDFYFDIVIVTDRRLVDINHEQLFFRQISELTMEDVEDVSSVVRGFLQTTFNYGTIEIQTAGNRPNFTMDNVLHPREITSIISDLSQQAKRGTRENERRPEGRVVGIIDNRLITSFEDLISTGAISPDTVRK